MFRTEVIETMAGKVAAELARRGIGSDERVIVKQKSSRVPDEGCC